VALKQLKLGQRVEYRSADGFAKAAYITGLPETIKSGTDVPVPAEGEAHLLVVSPTGKTYVRHSVKRGDGPRQFNR
jgi:hypothetical protein